MSRWNFDLFALALLLLLAAWVGRSRPGAVGIVVLAIIFLSPLCALSSALFSARVVHHVLLVAIAAPLLALARPDRMAAGTGLPFLLATIMLWLWHIPAFYDAALGHKAVYWAMQASLFGSAFWFWRAVFAQPAGFAGLWILFAYIAMGLLGALLTAAPDTLYATHAVGPELWGLSSLSDQQLGGLLMWVPAGLPYALWGTVIARRAWRHMGAAT
jgi:putative membrane protein